MIKPSDKRALTDWEEFVDNMNRESPIDLAETEVEKRKRIEKLERDHEAWFKYYFAKFYSAEPAPFHLRSTKRVMDNPEWFEVRPWSRELSKSGRTMMEVLKLALTGKKRNIILTSNNKDNAIRLLKPYKLLLERNNRIINDYGKQESYGDWSESEFITRKGVAFRAIGAGQSPRGTRNDEVRPDCIIIDDFDTDEDCRNPDTVDYKWDWLERALIPTRSISVPLLIIFNGNIIAEYCCVVKAIEVADHYEIVNIRDKNGVSTWPSKNTEELIDIALRPLSYTAQQAEYYNNPITQGKIFPKLHYKKMQPIKDYKILVAYADPSYKGSKKNDYKALMLLGKWQDEIHVLRIFCAQTTTAEMLDWYYEIMDYVGDRVPVYYYIEWPSIDDMFKLELKEAATRHGKILPLQADERNKPEKFHRIESALEPLNRREKLWFNEQYKTSDHTKATESQFKALSPTSRAHDDAPDAVEGGYYKLNQIAYTEDIGKITYGKRPTNNKRA